MQLRRLWFPCVLWMTAACADGSELNTLNDDDGAGGGGGSVATSGVGGTGGSGGVGGDSSDGGAGGAGGEATSVGATTSSAASGGGSNDTVNGCTKASAKLIEGNLSPIIMWNESLGTACYKAAAPLTIIFKGDFNAHPLEGGVAPVTDAKNPVTIHKNGLVGFTTAGAFGFFCSGHPATMRGAFFID